MRKFFAALLVSVCSINAYAGGYEHLQTLSGQEQFRVLSEVLGAVLSYKPISAGDPLGASGFEMGVGLASTFLRDDVNVTSFVPIVLLPRLSAHKGLPAGFDIGLSYTGDLKSDDYFYFKLLAAEIRYAMLEDTPATPGIAMRGSYSNLLGIDGFNFDTRAIDMTVSKAWGRKAKPYAGIGQVWVNSAPQNISINGIPLKSENFNLIKMFAGINLNFGLTNIDFEADRTGSFNSYNFKVAFRF